MIIVRKNILSFNGIMFKCSIGKNGVSNQKVEGDGCTPAGKYSFENVYYREDRVCLPKIELPKIPLNKDLGWCDDINSEDYNRPINFPYEYNAELLHRVDNIYDIICVINYNFEPIIKGRGSAIFMHVARDGYAETEGCIALKLEDLIWLLSQINKKTNINILA